MVGLVSRIMGSAECQNLFEFRLADDDKITGSGVSAKFYEDDVLFFESNTPTFVTKAQYYGKLIFSLGLGRHSKFDLSGGFDTCRIDFIRQKY